MIIKSYELQKIRNNKNKIYLFYGDNEGYKFNVIEEIFLKNFKENILRYEESEILSNYESFISNLLNKSFFEEKKLIIVSRVTDKIISLIDYIIDRNIDDITFILNSKNLDKKSKIRSLFEKNKDLVCIPFYPDDKKTLIPIAIDFFKKNKIPYSQEIINLIIERSSGDRKNLNNELEKILVLFHTKKKITLEEVLQLTNLSENYSISELTDNCLSKNLKRTVKIINENNFSSEDCIIIIRSLLSKSKRLLKLKNNSISKKNVEEVISSYKPPIFWKDKEVVKKQIESWSVEESQKLIYEINNIELSIKKNSSNSLNILSDFLLNKSRPSV
tara:strand:- start:9161 stop:10153 length:993 start_codon:yes stop_codon:yes gene_type:complete